MRLFFFPILNLVSKALLPTVTYYPIVYGVWPHLQSLEDIPADLALFWDVTEATAQVILSIAVILMVLLPVMYLTKGKNSALSIEIILLFLAECLLVGIGWLPFWVLIATIAVLALVIATLGTDVIFGGG